MYSTKKNHSSAYRTAVVLIMLFALLITVIAALLPDGLMSQESFAKEGVYIANPIEEYGKPESFSFDFEVSSTNGTGNQPFKLSQTGAGNLGNDFVDPAAIMTKINSVIGTTAANTAIRITFGAGGEEITFRQNEYLNITKIGKYVLTGKLSGYVGLDTAGLVTITGATGSTKVYLDGFTLTNKASWNRNNVTSLTSAGYDPLFSNSVSKTGYTQYTPKGLYVVSGLVDVYVLGNSDIKCTNEYFFLTNHEQVATSADSLGYADTASAHNGIGASGIGKTLSVMFTELGKSASTVAGNYSSYPSAIENLLQPLLNTAYGEGSAYRRANGAIAADAILAYYRNKPMDAWVKSDRTKADGDARINDFADIYSWSNQAQLGWMNNHPTTGATLANGTAATYTISTRTPATGAAVYFGSTGSLVIDTSGEISNYGMDTVETATTTTFANATVEVVSANFSYENGTRLYVKDGNIINRYYDVYCLRTYDTAGTASNSTLSLKSGLLFDLKQTNNTSNVASDLLEGGTYICPASILWLYPDLTAKAPRVTVGKADGTGPEMVSGVLAGQTRAQDKVIKYMGDPSPTPQKQLMLWQSAIMIVRGGFIGTTYVRSDLVFLGGKLTSHRNSAISSSNYNSASYYTAYDVHLMGGEWKSGDYGLYGFIKNDSTGGVATASDSTAKGMTIYAYGAGDYKWIADGRNCASAGISISAKVNYYASTSYIYGVFMASAASGSAPLFCISGGEFYNNDMQQGLYADMFLVNTAVKRDINIDGGYFSSDCGMFIRHYQSAADVIMTGGKFEVTGQNTNAAIIVGHMTALITGGSYTWDNADMSTLSMTGGYSATWTKQARDSYGYGGTGIVYLNGGEIVGNNNTIADGLIKLSKSNDRTALVMGLKPKPITNSETPYGYDPEDKADNVTKITNKGISPIIKIIPGTAGSTTSSTLSYPVGENPRVFGENRTVTQTISTTAMYNSYFGNSRVIIDKVDFAYEGYGDSFNGASIWAVPTLPTYELNELNYDDLVAYPKLIFTGTLSKTSKVSGLQGYIESGTNVVHLTDTFNDEGYGAGGEKKHTLHFANINSERAINNFLIKNYIGDGYGDQDSGYTGHFALHSATQLAAILRYSASTHSSASNQGLDFYKDEATKTYEWRRYTSFSVNFFTQKGRVNGNGNPISQTPVKYTGTTETASFASNNLPGGYTAGVSKMFAAASGVKSYLTYGEIVSSSGYIGDVFPAGHASAGMPKLKMDGYEHLGWSYTGYVTPYFGTTSALNFHNTAYTRYTNIFSRLKVKASDQLWNYFDHFLVAEWKLEDPKFSDGRIKNTTGTAGVIGNGDAGSSSWNLNRTYSAYDETSLTGISEHDSENIISLSMSYAWHYLKVGGNANTDWALIAGATGNTLSGIKNVSQNGTYRLTVTATDDTLPSPMTASITYSWVVNIQPRQLTADNIFMPTVQYDTFMHSPLMEGFFFYESKTWNTSAQKWDYTKINLNDGTGLASTDGIDFTCTPGINAMLSGIRAWPFYFNFFNNYSGTNIMVEFVIWGDLTVMFGNTKSAAVDIMGWDKLVPADIDGDGQFEALLYPELPKPLGVNGYTFSHWTFQGEKVEKNSRVTVEYAHTLYAVWIMDSPTVTTKANGVNTSELKFEFDRSTHYFVADASIGSPALNTLTFGYSWQKWVGGALNTSTGVWEGGSAADEPASGLSALPRINVETRSHYKLTVTARDTDGLISTTVKDVWIEITQKAISASDIKIPSQPYDGSAKSAYISIVHNGFYLEEGADFIIVNKPAGYPNNMTEPGNYTFEFEFIGNYKNAAADSVPSVTDSSKLVIKRDFMIFTNITISFGNLKPGVTPVSAAASNITITNSSLYPNLPAPVLPDGFKGYTFLRWEYNGIPVAAGDTIQSIINHTLLAVWEIKNPTVTPSIVSIDIIYDRANHPVTVSAAVDGLTVGLVFTYSWERLTYYDNGVEKAFTGSYYFAGATNYFVNVADSGKYRCTVTITDGTLTKTTPPIEVEIKIAKKNIEDADISGTLAVPTGTFANGAQVNPVISLVHNGVVLQINSEYDWCAEDGTQIIKPQTAGENFNLTISGKGNYYGTIIKNFAVDVNVYITYVTAIGTAPKLDQLSDPYTNYPAALPVLANVPGYTFNGWEYIDGGGIRRTAADGGGILVSGSHILHAKWSLNAIVMTAENEGQIIAGLIGEYIRAGYSVTANPSISDASQEVLREILFVYEWKRQSDGFIAGTSATFIRTGAESAYYTLTITAYGQAGLSRTYTIDNIRVYITQRSINDSLISVYMPAKNIANSSGRAALEYSITFSGVLLTAGTDFTIRFYNSELQEYTTVLPENYGVGSYTFLIEGINNFKDSRTVIFEVTSVVTISFYTVLGSTPAAVAPVEGKYPALPVPANAPSGYTFVKWQYNDADLPANNALAYDGSHLLTAVWKLNAIKLENETEVNGGLSGIYRSSGYSLIALPYIDGYPTGINFAYEWIKAGSNTPFSTAQKLTVTNIADSGYYTLKITAVGLSGLTPDNAYTLTGIIVDIVQINIKDSAVAVYMPAKTIGGQVTSVGLEYTITYDGITLSPDTDFTLYYKNSEGVFVTAIPGSFTAGDYIFKIAGKGNFKDEREVTFSVSANTKISFFTMLGEAPGSVDPAADNKYPVLADPSAKPAGYKFEGWYYNGNKVAAGDTLAETGSHTLTAVWTLNTLTNNNQAANANGAAGVYKREGYSLTAAPAIAGNPAGITYTYEWKRQSDGMIKSTTAILSLINVSDSGLYTLTIKAIGQAGISAEYTLKNIAVSITPRPISEAMITIINKTVSSSSEKVSFEYIITYGNVALTLADEYGILYMGDADTFPSMYGVGVYTFRFEGKGNFDGYVEKTFTVSDPISANTNIYFNSILTGLPPIPSIPPVDGKFQNLPDAGFFAAYETEINGYNFMGWTLVYGSKTLVANGEPAGTGNIYLYAVWELKAIDFTNITANFNRTYILNNSSVLTLNAGHDLLGASGISVSYEWKWQPLLADGSYGAETNTRAYSYNARSYTVADVADSGKYTLTVTIVDGLGNYVTREHTFIVIISPKVIKSVVIGPKTYNGNIQAPSVYSFFDEDGVLIDGLILNVDYTVDTQGHIFRDAKTYENIQIRFSGNITFTGNYKCEGAYIAATYTINGYKITFANNDLKGNPQPLEQPSSATGTYGSLPDLVISVDGYTFKGWKTQSGQIVNGGTAVNGDTVLYPVWEMDAPGVNYSTGGISREYIPSQDLNASQRQLTVDPSLNVAGNIVYTYKWYYAADGINFVEIDGYMAGNLGLTGWNNTKTLNGIYEVRHSGKYYVVITATDTGGLTSTVTCDFTVKITPKVMDKSNIVIDPVNYSGAVISPDGRIRIRYMTYNLEEGTDYDILQQSDIYKNAADYTILFRFKGNYTQEGEAVSQIYSIRPYLISFANINDLTVSGIYCTGDGKYPGLPKLTGVSGYTHIGWEYNGMAVGEGYDLSVKDNHYLRAVWKLNTPEVQGVNDINGIFNWTDYTLTASATVGTLTIGADIDITYTWTRRSDSVVVSSGKTLALRNVSDSGEYILTITVYDRRGLTNAADETNNRSVYTTTINVNISPKQITQEAVDIPVQVFTGTGIKPPITVMDNGNVVEITEYEIFYDDGSGNTVRADNFDFVNVGTYTIAFHFKDNFYGEFNLDFEIIKSKSIVEAWWLWVVIAAAIAAICFVIWLIYYYLKQKRKKYGMKRHVHSFMDDFDLQN